MKLFHWVVSAPFFIIILFSLVTSLKGILQKRAFVIPAWWLGGSILLFAIPPLVLAQLRCLRCCGFLDDLFIFLLIVAVFEIARHWFINMGYLAFGTTESTFINALKHALTKLELEYEGKPPVIRLLAKYDDIHVGAPSVMSSKRILTKNKELMPTLKEIAREMDHYLQNHKVDVHMFPYYVYLSLGAGLSILWLTLFAR